jgi:hypothetical protein
MLLRGVPATLSCGSNHTRVRALASSEASFWSPKVRSTFGEPGPWAGT